MQALKAALTHYRAELWQVLAIVLATLLSFLIASWLNLAEPFWSVITAAIVARITARGAVRVAAYRLLGTLAGALFGLVLAFARSTGTPESVLLVLLVAPLGLLGVLRRELRAALIAGIIVFSAGHRGRAGCDHRGIGLGYFKRGFPAAGPKRALMPPA